MPGTTTAPTIFVEGTKCPPCVQIEAECTSQQLMLADRMIRGDVLEYFRGEDSWLVFAASYVGAAAAPSIPADKVSDWKALVSEWKSKCVEAEEKDEEPPTPPHEDTYIRLNLAPSLLACYRACKYRDTPSSVPLNTEQRERYGPWVHEENREKLQELLHKGKWDEYVDYFNEFILDRYSLEYFEGDWFGPPWYVWLSWQFLIEYGPTVPPGTPGSRYACWEDWIGSE